MRNLLVTGGAGFIGSNFVRYILGKEPGVRVVVLDALTYAGSLENLKDLPDEDRHTFVHGDICDRPLVDRLLREHAIDTIVHFAAESHVDRSILDPAPFIQTNVVGTFTLLEAARQAWLADGSVPSSEARFLHVSTDEVYGSLEPGEPAFTEDSPYAPSSPYAASKAAADHLVRAFSRTYGLPILICNCSNTYGPYQYPEKLVPLTILNALGGRPLPVYGDGQQRREWLHVDDLCEGMLAMLRRGRLGEAYNLGTDDRLTNAEAIERICRLLDDFHPRSDIIAHGALITHVADRPGHDRGYALDARKIRTELGWEPLRGLEDGLRETVVWYLEHWDWLLAIQGRPSYQLWYESNYARREALRR